MENNQIYDKLLFGDVYYTSRELRYANDIALLSNVELQDFKEYKKELLKSNDDKIQKLDLISFNNAPLFYVNGKCLKYFEKDYYDNVFRDLKDMGMSISKKHYHEMMVSRVYSEIEGSLAVENVPTTRLRIERLKKGASPQDKNDQIVKNMLNAIDYIETRPAFNKDNLLKLYSILSEGCLEGHSDNTGYYRNEMVYIDRYEGCPIEKIEECMNSLFAFVNNKIGDPKYSVVLPYIAHYYIVYVHPYFDFNGRTARMVSLWLSLLIDEELLSPIYISEAINDAKKLYYNALRETRDMNNDLTYFMLYMFDIAIKYNFVYKNVDVIEEELLKKGYSLSNVERTYVKKIIIHAKDTYFDYKRYLDFINVEATKQAAFKMLSRFEEYGLLTSIKGEKNNKLFKFNDKLIKFKV